MRKDYKLCLVAVTLLAVTSACNSPTLLAPTTTPAQTPTPANTLTPVPPTFTPTWTPLPTITPTVEPTATPTPTPLPTPMAIVVSVMAETDVKLRREPDAAAEVVGQLPPGTFVMLTDMTDDGMWLKIGLGDQVGWTPGVNVSLTGAVAVDGSTAQDRQPLLQADTPVNVRSGPGINYKPLGQLKSGQVVPVQGDSDDHRWLEIRFEGHSGWVSVDTVIVAGAQPTATPVVTEEVTREP